MTSDSLNLAAIDFEICKRVKTMRKTKRLYIGLACVVLLATTGMFARAQMGAGMGAGEASDPFSNFEVSIQHVAGNVYMIRGVSSNMAVSIGDDGAVIVDDNFAPLTEKIVAAIRTVADVPIRFVINTHHHGDHTGGNLNLGTMGAVIMSTENARMRLVTNPADEGGPAPAGALPVVTFRDRTTLHFNGEEVRVFPVAPSHTDGDAYIHFVDSDVIATGDVFVTIAYPYVRPPHGGRFSGYFENLETAIALSGPNTKIVPGHGRVSTRDDLMEYRDMLVVVRDRVAEMIRQGMALEEVINANPTAQYDERWGSGQPPDVPFTVEEFLANVYNDLAGAN